MTICENIEMPTANSYYNGFGQLAEWKVGFVFGMIWQIRRMGLI